MRSWPRRTRKGNKLNFNLFLVFRYEKQAKEIEAKGYYIRADGTKSTDVEVGKKRKSTKSAKKGTKKTSNTDDKKRKSKSKTDKKEKSAKKAKKTKDSDEDEGELDIEDSNGESD